MHTKKKCIVLLTICGILSAGVVIAAGLQNTLCSVATVPFIISNSRPNNKAKVLHYYQPFLSFSLYKDFMWQKKTDQYFLQPRQKACIVQQSEISNRYELLLTLIAVDKQKHYYKQRYRIKIKKSILSNTAKVEQFILYSIVCERSNKISATRAQYLLY